MATINFADIFRYPEEQLTQYLAQMEPGKSFSNIGEKRYSAVINLIRSGQMQNNIYLQDTNAIDAFQKTNDLDTFKDYLYKHAISEIGRLKQASPPIPFQPIQPSRQVTFEEIRTTPGITLTEQQYNALDPDIINRFVWEKSGQKYVKIGPAITQTRLDQIINHPTAMVSMEEYAVLDPTIKNRFEWEIVQLPGGKVLGYKKVVEQIQQQQQQQLVQPTRVQPVQQTRVQPVQPVQVQHILQGMNQMQPTRATYSIDAQSPLTPDQQRQLIDDIHSSKSQIILVDTDYEKLPQQLKDEYIWVRFADQKYNAHFYERLGNRQQDLARLIQSIESGQRTTISEKEYDLLPQDIKDKYEWILQSIGTNESEYIRGSPLPPNFLNKILTDPNIVLNDNQYTQFKDRINHLGWTRFEEGVYPNVKVFFRRKTREDIDRQKMEGLLREHKELKLKQRETQQHPNDVAVKAAIDPGMGKSTYIYNVYYDADVYKRIKEIERILGYQIPENNRIDFFRNW